MSLDSEAVIALSIKNIKSKSVIFFQKPHKLL